MKKILVILLSVMLIFTTFTACKKEPETKTEIPVKTSTELKADAYFVNLPDDQNMISAENLFKKIDNHEAMFIIDIRPAELYNNFTLGLGHIKGAVNLPFGQIIADNLKYIPNDKPVFVYSDAGSTAAQVTALFIVAGINAKSVQSGFMGISNLDNYVQYVDDVAVSMPSNVYTVDANIQQSITKYFSDMSALENTVYKEYSVKPATLKAAIDANSSEYYVVSERKAADFANGHIKGSVNIPFEKGMQEKFSTLPKNKKIIVYCYWGEVSYQSVAILRLLGYDAYGLFGGEGGHGWLNAGYPLETN